jgi:ubiquinone/menaquinone biosynthesis C-methylase UbiE
VERAGIGEISKRGGRMEPVDRERQDKYVAKEFDRQARRYDDSITVGAFQRRTQALVVDEMQVEKGMYILDLGCGTGTATLEIASRLEGAGKVVGLDLSKKMLEQAERKLARLGYANVEFVVGNGTDLGYEGCFDYVLSTNAFHHFGHKAAVFSQVWQSLRPGGVFLVQDICDDFILMRAVDLAGKLGERAHVGSTTARGLKKLLVSAGFSEVEVEITKLNWFWGIMIGKGVKQIGG